MKEATGYIRGFGYRTAYTWLDNDNAGKKATQVFSEFLTAEHITHVAMNLRYAPFKDVNAWHVAKLGF